MVLFLASAVASTGCSDNVFEQKWTIAEVDTALIYSLARPELNLPSGFDFVNRAALQIQSPGATGFWDVLLDTQDGELVFILPGALDISSATLVLAMPETSFDDILTAPKDTTLYTRDLALPVDAGTVYVVRTHRGPDRFGTLCSFFGKFQPVVVEPANETVQFAYDVNVLCDDRALVPPDA